VKSEDLLYALGELDSAAVMRAGEILERRSTRPIRLRAVRVLLVAAALLFALGGIGWYVYHSAMSARIPDDGGRTVFRAVSFAEGEDRPLNYARHHTALSIRVNTEAESRLCLFRAPRRESATGTGRKNLYALLGESSSAQKIPDIRMDLEEGLRQAGMNRFEAGEYCTWWVDRGGEAMGVPKLTIELLNACELCGTELILTTEDGAAEIIRQEENGVCDRLEVEYSGRLDVNYLFQYVPEMQYLLVICGDAAEYGFPDLEAVADGLQIRQTELIVPRYEESYDDWRPIEQPEIWLRDDNV
jgi:hypothetical protein